MGKGFVIPSVASCESVPGVGDFVCTHGKPERGVWTHEPAMEVRVKAASLTMWKLRKNLWI